MRILVIGAGAMGGVLGARLARAGADIVLYDRDAEHVAAIRKTGLYVSTPTGDIHLPIPATMEIGTLARPTGPSSWSTATPRQLLRMPRLALCRQTASF